MGLNVAVVGVGPVGDRILRCLKERSFPLAGPPVVMATSARTEALADEEVQVQKTAPELFEGVDVVFFAGREGAKGASREWADVAIKAGAYCVDNGSDFRMYPDIPLVVPEVNMDAVTPDTTLIASPNCSTTQLVVAVAPLHRAAGIKRIVVSTYQSVSGWGLQAMQELDQQLCCLARGDEVSFDPCVFTRRICLDCIPHIDRFTSSGYTKEELKMVNETRKIMGAPEMQVSPTAVRVPVMIGHAESINLEFRSPLSAAEAREILADPDQSPGVVLMDGPALDPHAVASRKAPDELHYPTQADVLQDQYKDMVLVGRVRDDMTVDHGVNLWCVADNLRKGAATNVVQIAERMIERGFFAGKV
jgi:aspartate-semialdehyde dehydrogenase